MEASPMSTLASRWAPAAVLAVGALALFGSVREQVSLPLRAALDTTVPTVIEGQQARDIPISAEEQKVSGVSNYVLRSYEPQAAAGVAAFSVYVGYYDRQMQGKTIHSPKNCLPGAGWEPLTSREEVIQTAAGAIPVQRYLIQNGEAKAVVLYWYQGRGRVAANEYAVKWHLLRDQALHGRSDEALVRVIAPVTSTEEEAYRQAIRVAGTLVPAVYRAIPA
jgi:EpsI family protein